MKFLKIDRNTTLADLSNMVGERNVSSILNLNGLERTVNIGRQAIDRASQISGKTDWQTKLSILNTMTYDSDVFEKAALGTDADWNCLNIYGTFPDYLRIPDNIDIPLSDNVLGNNEPISPDIYKMCEKDLKTSETHEIDPSIFTEYSSSGTGAYGMSGGLTYDSNTNPFEYFQLPWGKISLYSSLSGEMVDFPVYPISISDGYTASYETMPDMLYQYEPWYVYKSSGPRQNSYTFEMHRDMWTGDHRDGLANNLVRFCEANCFPHYSGSTVNAPTVTLLMNSEVLIKGILTSVKTEWSGPLGLDGFYLELKLTLDITEVSDTPLDYSTVRQKGLVG